jgi:hypothetical protein
MPTIHMRADLNTEDDDAARLLRDVTDPAVIHAVPRAGAGTERLWSVVRLNGSDDGQVLSLPCRRHDAYGMSAHPGNGGSPLVSAHSGRGYGTPHARPPV